MKFNARELEFLAAWAREERSPESFAGHAHKLQAEHKVPSVTFIRAIEAWARKEHRKDEDIFDLYSTSNPSWPWTSPKEMAERLSDVEHKIEV